MKFFPLKIHLKTWWIASRPKTLSASFVPILVATSLAKMDEKTQPLSSVIIIFSFLSATFIQIGTNLINDAIDFRKGVDSEERIGPLRVTQSGLMSLNTVFLGGIFCFFLALLCGIPLILKGGFPILVIGCLSLLFGYLYTGGPYPLSYLGLGEFFVLLFFGPIAVGGIYYLHTLSLNFSVLITGFQMGLLCTVLIAINNLRDIEQDRKALKKTLAVRFGIPFCHLKISLLLLSSFLMSFYWFLNNKNWPAFLPWLSFPLALFIVIQIYRHPPHPIYNSFLALSSLLYIFFGGLLSLSFFFSLKMH